MEPNQDVTKRFTVVPRVPSVFELSPSIRMVESNGMRCRRRRVVGGDQYARSCPQALVKMFGQCNLSLRRLFDSTAERRGPRAKVINSRRWLSPGNKPGEAHATGRDRMHAIISTGFGSIDTTRARCPSGRGLQLTRTSYY